MMDTTTIAILGGALVVVLALLVVGCWRAHRVKKQDAMLAEMPTRTRHMPSPGLEAHVAMVSPELTYNSSVYSAHTSSRANGRLPTNGSAASADQLRRSELDRYTMPVRLTKVASPRPAPQTTLLMPVGSLYQQREPQPWDDPVFIASRLPMDAISTGALISRGGFGEVYQGIYRGQVVALKKLLPEARRDLKQIASFFSEIKLMATMEHERIVQYIGVAWDALSNVCVVTEFMEGGDLRSALDQFETVDRRAHGIDKQKATIALHVAHALIYMHSLQPMTLHRDLKSKNVLLDASRWNAKLVDFGVSRERSDMTMTAGVGTLLWMAPEVVAGEKYDDKADVFSFGIVLSELDTHRMPYADVKQHLARENGRNIPDTVLLQQILSGQVTVSFSKNLREDIHALAKSCVSLDPSKRPTSARVLYDLHTILNSL